MKVKILVYNVNEKMVKVIGIKSKASTELNILQYII